MADKNVTPLSKLTAYYNEALSAYEREHRKMFLLDATDKGELWKALGIKFPEYQILPDTNFISYIKNNILASLYTVTKSADILATSEADAELCMKLSIALENIWDVQSVGWYEFLAGENAALTNLGITQVGWDDRYIGGSGDLNFTKGQVVFKNIDPLHFMRDPYAENLQEGRYTIQYSEYSKEWFLANPKYRETFAELDPKHASQMQSVPNYFSKVTRSQDDHYRTLLVYHVRECDGSLSEYHVVNNSYILYEKHNLRPDCFPYAELYCNLPGSGLIGISEPARIFSNNVAYNLLHSIALTAEYKNQNPPKFISTRSGLNVSSFARHGDEAGRTFIVNGDATQAVHYQQFPPVSNTLMGSLQTLQYNIQNVTGIDERYTGRDTGSIITTGGTEEMLNRVTLTDAPKIKTYEKYAKDLTKLVLLNMLEFSPVRSYYVRDPQDTGRWMTMEVDFPQIDPKTLFHYDIEISSELPKNRQRIMDWANTMMEKQMQYQQAGQTVDLITQEEWVQMQDIPIRERMLARMGFQRDTDALSETAQVLDEFGQAVSSGVSEDDALALAAQGLRNKRMGEPTPLEQNPTPTAQTDLSPTDLL